MLLRRVMEDVKRQNWTAVVLDFVIVVVGVYIGIQAANWNDQRASRVDTNRSLSLMRTYIDDLARNAVAFKRYYAITKTYGEKALQGWADKEALTDTEFLASAYQASQIMGSTSLVIVVADTIGAQNIRMIKNPALRRSLGSFIANPTHMSRSKDIDTPYRRNVRRAIPFSIQEIIRATCGDQRDDVGSSVSLPEGCDIDISARNARTAASALRSKLDLRDDLQWHMASIESVLFDLERELERNAALKAAIESYLK